MITMKERLKELREEINFKDKKKKKKIKEIKIDSKKKRKTNLVKELKKKYKKWFVDYLLKLPEEELEEELRQLEFQEQEAHRIEYNKALKKRKKKEKKSYIKKFNKYMKSKKNKIKCYLDYLKYKKKFKKMMKKKDKSNTDKNVFDYNNIVELDEKKLIKSIKSISKEQKQRTDLFLEFVDKLYRGEDIPTHINGLLDKNGKLVKDTQKYMRELQDNTITLIPSWYT